MPLQYPSLPPAGARHTTIIRQTHLRHLGHRPLRTHRELRSHAIYVTQCGELVDCLGTTGLVWTYFNRWLSCVLLYWGTAAVEENGGEAGLADCEGQSWDPKWQWFVNSNQ